MQVDEGRLLRPLLVLPPPDADRLRDASVDDLLAEGRLRYVDPAECATLDLSIDVAEGGGPCDAVEVHALLMLGVTAACIPLLQCNQSPRNHTSAEGGGAFVHVGSPFGSSKSPFPSTARTFRLCKWASGDTQRRYARNAYQTSMGRPGRRRLGRGERKRK